MEPVSSKKETTFPFTSTDSITSTIVAQTSEPTLRLELHYLADLDQLKLLESIKKLINEEPILNCHLIDGRRPKWERLDSNQEVHLKHFTCDFSYQKFKSEPINIHNGPLIQCALLKKGEKNIFLIKIAHEVADGFGVKQAATRIAKHYRDNIDTPAQINTAIKQSRSSLRLLSFIPFHSLLTLFLTYIKDKRDMFSGGKTINISHDIFSNADPGYISRTISRELTINVRKTARIKGVTINDVLLTAFLRAIAGVSEDEEELFRICMTVNLRKYLNDPDNMPISNLSSIECINLKRNLGSDFESTLNQVHGKIEKKKKSWIGLGIIFDLLIQKPMPFSMRKSLHKGFVDTSIKERNTAFLLTNVGKLTPEALEMEAHPYDIELLGPVVFSPFWNTVVSEYDGTIKLTSYMYNSDKRSSKLNDIYSQVVSELQKFSSFNVTQNHAVIEDAIV